MSNLNFVRFSIVQLADYQTDSYRNLYINRFSHSVTAKLIDSSREYLQQKIYMIALLSLIIDHLQTDICGDKSAALPIVEAKISHLLYLFVFTFI